MELPRSPSLAQADARTAVGPLDITNLRDKYVLEAWHIGELKELGNSTCIYIDQEQMIISSSLGRSMLISSCGQKATIPWSEAMERPSVVDRNDELSVPRPPDASIGGSVYCQGCSGTDAPHTPQAIARTLYARRRLNVFDDVLSGVDATTEGHIITRVFGPRGLIERSQSCTAIFSSNSSKSPVTPP